MTMTMKEQRDELLEALEGIQSLMGYEWLLPDFNQARDAIAAIKSAKAEEVEQEPVVEYIEAPGMGTRLWKSLGDYVPQVGDKLYTSPQPAYRELSDEEINRFWESSSDDDDGRFSVKFAHAILAAAKGEKK